MLHLVDNGVAFTIARVQEVGTTRRHRRQSDSEWAGRRGRAGRGVQVTPHHTHASFHTLPRTLRHTQTAATDGALVAAPLGPLPCVVAARCHSVLHSDPWTWYRYYSDDGREHWTQLAGNYQLVHWSGHTQVITNLDSEVWTQLRRKRCQAGLRALALGTWHRRGCPLLDNLGCR